MGLVADLNRKVISMGLIPKLLKQLPKLAEVFMVVAIVMMLILPMDGQYRNTYISENALMPSQAYSYFRESEWNVLRGYRTQIEEFLKNNTSAEERNLQVSSWLQDFGVKTSIYHNKEHNDTLYGILHTPRGDGTEAIVLSIPWFNTDNEFNIGGAALGISLLRYFSRWPIWSKNLMIVFSENPNDSLRAWVDAYHKSLDLTGGSIEAAVNLDFPGNNDFFDYVEIYYDGLNGELPNLDLVNIAVSITQHESVKVSLNHLPKEELDDNDYLSRLKTLMLGIKDSTLAGVKKTHGNEAFSGWRIQAITLKACGREGNIDITTFGRISEAIFRSVNNLLEKFHQSFFFYLLLAPKNFVSISSYLPSAVIISVAYAISSLDALVNTPFGTPSFYNKESLISLLLLSIFLAMSFILSQLFIYLPKPELLLGINIGVTLMPYFIRKQVSLLKESLTYRIRVLGYLYISLVLTSLLMINFPLAFVIGIMAFPLTYVKTQTSNSSTDKKIMLRNILCLLASNPFISVFVLTNLLEPELANMDIFYGLVSAWENLSCWTWFVICIGWLPAWLSVALSSVKSSPNNPIDEEKKQQ